jgi:hypothetical protein
MRKSSAFAVLLILVNTPADAVPTVQWGRQFGTAGYDQAHGVSADGLGNVYVSGYTSDGVALPDVGHLDAYVAKYDGEGTLEWYRKFGTNDDDRGYSVSADMLGNVYVAGLTRGDLGATGVTNIGLSDAFVRKYDASGALQWSRQIGTNSFESSYGASVDGLGNVYVAGFTGGGDLDGTGAGGENPFVSKYSTDGTHLWTRQNRLIEGAANDVSTDGLGNVYVSGTIVANRFGGGDTELDAYLSKYDADGQLQWTQQLGTSRDERGWGVSADELGNVFMWGYTTGDLAAPSTTGFDAFVSKYNPQGQLQWVRQLGTFSLLDSFGGVSADGQGNVYFAGTSLRDLVGGNSDNWDAIVGKYNSNGDLVWIRQFVTGEIDDAYGISWDGNDNLYVSGRSFGSLWGSNLGLDDSFLMKINDPIPEPSPLELVGIATLVSLYSSARWGRSTPG